jgi:plastocyanin
MRPVKFDADPKCGELNRQEVLEETVVARDGLLANVIAYAKSGAERWTYAAAPEEVVLDQAGCTYRPHVFTIRTGQPLVIRNSDPLLHNTHAVPAANLEFNRTQLKGAKDITEKFAKEEVGVRVKCDVHGWMGAWAGVFAHPFHGVTGADGTAAIRLPPGTFEIAAWHEYAGFSKPAPQSVTIAAGETKEIEFEFAVP